MGLAHRLAGCCDAVWDPASTGPTSHAGTRPPPRPAAHPPRTPAAPRPAAVLGGSSILEAYSLRVAFNMLKQSAEEDGMGVWQYLRRGRDPTTAGARGRVLRC